MAIALGCGAKTSSSSHWLTCSLDSDCSNLDVDARCGGDGVCASATGTRLVQKLVFSDEFDGTALDGARWVYETGADIRNDEVQAYTNRRSNVSVESGELVLTGRAEEYDGASFTSGSVNTEGRFSFAFGRIEARFAAPTARGCSAAFWMLPEDPAPDVQTCLTGLPCYAGTWPAWGDITIANLQSQLPGRVLGTISYGVWDDATGSLKHGVFSGQDAKIDDASAYHTYALEWGPARMDWFIDDVRVRTVALPPDDMYLPDGIDPFRRPFHVRMNLALGGLDQAPDPAAYPQELRIDWIRVWQWQAER